MLTRQRALWESHVANDKMTRKLAAIVAADVAGYSRLMGADEEGTLSVLKTHRRELIDSKIKEYGGRIVKTTGDGMLLEFSSVVDAVRCCLDVQHGMVVRNNATPVERRIQFRVGVNLGDVIIDDEDIFGEGVNIAARLEAMADPGGICISKAVLDQVKGKLALDLEDLGNTALKNIEEPVRTYRIVQAGKKAKPTASSDAAGGSSNALPPLPERPSVAILPFRNLQGNAETDFIADGIGLGIQTLLVQLSGLFMVNACAHQGYRDGKVTAAEALKEVPVRYALEGAVQQSGERVRVTAQLTDLRDGAVTWADRYDRDLEDVFALQDDVTREVITSLSSEILGGDLSRIWTSGLTGRGAWEYFLRSVSHFYKFTAADNAAARAMSEKIYELHPDKVIGPSYIAMTHWLDAARGWSEKPEASLEQARKWAEKSIATDEENNGLGYIIMGSLRLRERRFDEALALGRKGISFRGNCPFALGQLAVIQNYCGDPQGAVKTAREALTVRMIYPPPLVNVLATAYRDSGEIGLSIPAAREATRLDPGHTDALVTLCSDYMLASDKDRAGRVADQIIGLDPEFRISAYANNLPYRDATRTASIVETLRSAGLPE